MSVVEHCCSDEEGREKSGEMEDADWCKCQESRQCLVKTECLFRRLNVTADKSVSCPSPPFDSFRKRKKARNINLYKV